MRLSAHVPEGALAVGPDYQLVPAHVVFRSGDDWRRWNETVSLRNVLISSANGGGPKLVAGDPLAHLRASLREIVQTSIQMDFPVKAAGVAPVFPSPGQTLMASAVVMLFDRRFDATRRTVIAKKKRMYSDAMASLRNNRPLAGIDADVERLVQIDRLIVDLKACLDPDHRYFGSDVEKVHLFMYRWHGAIIEFLPPSMLI